MRITFTQRSVSSIILQLKESERSAVRTIQADHSFTLSPLSGCKPIENLRVLICYIQKSKKLKTHGLFLGFQEASLLKKLHYTNNLNSLNSGFSQPVAVRWSVQLQSGKSSFKDMSHSWERFRRRKMNYRSFAWPNELANRRHKSCMSSQAHASRKQS